MSDSLDRVLFSTPKLCRCDYRAVNCFKSIQKKVRRKNVLFLLVFLIVPHLNHKSKPLNDSFGSAIDPTSGIRAKEEVFCRI
ncbi:hypothetical protein HanIR_Chr14g0671791 [Helianthus annuus]|nr:hypothetical protein HanIR_Chr14g0671791 [Helianthus annuus]